jgi:hypothetical protein
MNSAASNSPTPTIASGAATASTATPNDTFEKTCLRSLPSDRAASLSRRPSASARSKVRTIS